MSMDMLKSMKQTLMCCAQGQMGHLESVDAKELGEVIDMIKDLEEAMYYCVITEAMLKGEKEGWGHGEEGHSRQYHDPYAYRDWDHGRMYSPKYNEYYQPYDIMYNRGRMYNDNGNGTMYNDNGNGTMYNDEIMYNGNGNGIMYHEKEWPYDMMMRDHREGKSPMSRRRYMEAKEMKQDKNTQLQELEKYIKELSHDVVEMIEDASPEEKKYLANKISALATKVSKLEND